jgi:hypothetical protein
MKLPAPGFGGGGPTHDVLIALAPDGKSAATLQISVANLLEQKTTLRVWSWPAGELKQTLTLEAPRDLLVASIRGRFTPDGKELLTASWCRFAQPPFSGPVAVPVLLDRWDVATGKRLDRKKLDNVAPVWAADGSRLLVVRDQGEVVDAFTEKAVARLPHHNTDPFTVWTLGGMALSPDGKTIAVGGDFMHPGSVRLCDVRSGHVRATLRPGGRGRLEVAFLPDGRIVSVGETAVVWAADAAEKVKAKRP